MGIVGWEVMLFWSVSLRSDTFSTRRFLGVLHKMLDGDSCLEIMLFWSVSLGSDRFFDSLFWGLQRMLDRDSCLGGDAFLGLPSENNWLLV